MDCFATLAMTRRLSISLVAITEMYSHTTRLNDPQRTRHGSGFEDRQKVLEAVENPLKSHLRPDVQDNCSSAHFRRKSHHLTKVAIEGHERSYLCTTHFEQLLVSNSCKALIPNRHHIVSGGLEKLHSATSDIFVELEFYATRPTGTRTVCSRAASAP
jgi:hypothetical protein